MLARFRMVVACTILCLLQTIATQPVQADQLVITALIPARPDHFQLELGTQPSLTSVQQGQIVTFYLTYGSYLAQATDTAIIVVDWSQGPLSSVNLKFIDNSATPALHGSLPTVDLNQSTLTWVIDPFSPGTNRQVSWQLHVDPQSQSTLPQSISINAQLTVAGVQVIATPLQLSLQSSSTPHTPSSTPATTITVTPTSSATIHPSTTPTSQPSETPDQPSLPQRLQTSSWLLISIALLLLSIIIWLIQTRFLLRLWLFLHRQTLLEGHITLNGQLLIQAQVILKQDRRITNQTTTNRYGYYRMTVGLGTYRMLLKWQDKSSPQRQPVKITTADFGQTLQRSIDLVE